MMLQSVDDILYLYPCWIKKPARFVRLRAKGAFIVSADYDGQEVSGLKIYSEQGNPCKICNPWQGSKVSVKLNGKPVSTAMNGNIIEVFYRVRNTLRNLQKIKTYINISITL